MAIIFSHCCVVACHFVPVSLCLAGIPQLADVFSPAASVAGTPQLAEVLSLPFAFAAAVLHSAFANYLPARKATNNRFKHSYWVLFSQESLYSPNSPYPQLALLQLSLDSVGLSLYI